MAAVSIKPRVYICIKAHNYCENVHNMHKNFRPDVNYSENIYFPKNSKGCFERVGGVPGDDTRRASRSSAAQSKLFFHIRCHKTGKGCRLKQPGCQYQQIIYVNHYIIGYTDFPYKAGKALGLFWVCGWCDPLQGTGWGESPPIFFGAPHVPAPIYTQSFFGAHLVHKRAPNRLKR